MSAASCDRPSLGILPLKTQLLRLQAELRHRVDDATPLSVQYLKKVVTQLRDVDGSRFADIRYNCLSECVKALYAAGEYELALVACGEMKSIAERTSKLEWERQTENFAGVMHAERGDLGQAIVCYRASLDLARQLENVDAEISILSNLGVAFTYGTLYRESIPSLTRGIELAKRTGEGLAYVPALLCNLAQAYLATGETSRARAAIYQSVCSEHAPSGAYGAHSRTIREWTFVDIALECRDLRAAKDHLGVLNSYVAKSGSKLGRFLFSLSRGLVDVHTGDVRHGLSTLQKALAESTCVGTIHRANAWIALVKAHETCGRPDEALRYMKVLMQELSQRRERQIRLLLGGNYIEESRINDGVELQRWKLWEAELRAASAVREVCSARTDLLERLAIASSLKDDPSGAHGYRVGRLSALLAEKLGWAKDACFSLEIAARLHDIGKVGVPDRIVRSSEPFQDAERHFMRSHAQMGAEILADSDVPQLRLAEEIARCHHERWDGEGYPSRLVGHAIPLVARIVALADAFDALTHGRPYAPVQTVDSAVCEIQRLAGRQFDPQLTTEFIDLLGQLRAKHGDLDVFLGRAAAQSPFLHARRKLATLQHTAYAA